MAEKIRIMKRTVDALRPRERSYVAWDADIHGFGVKVLPSGRKTYVFRYRVGGGRSGTSREPAIGPHGKLTPDGAREIAGDWARQVATGGDPGAAREAQRKAPLMGELLDRYLKDYAERHKKGSSVANDRRLIETRLRPALGRRKVAEVKRAEIEKLHGGLAGTPYEANRTLALLSKVFNLAESWDMRPPGSNPCRHVKRFKEAKRERFLSAQELARLSVALVKAERGELLGLKGAPIPVHAVAAIRLLIFTGARRGEVLALEWDWIDWEAGRAELMDSKTGRRFLYLPPPALEVLRSVPRIDGNPYVIAGRKRLEDDKRKPRGKRAALPGRALVNLKDAWLAIRKAAGLDDVRIHDLRHSFASVGAGAGMSLPMIGALLGHREVATTSRYAHLSDDPQRDAAALIGARIEAAMRLPEEGKEEADVVVMKASRRRRK